jgi:two-component system phosphate regulon sensor histidine kinase PhoR
MALASALAWLDKLDEGVVLVEGRRVYYLNRAAATFLEVEPDFASGAPLIAVLRDHRLEQALLEQQEIELQTRGRVLKVKPFAGGLLLRDVSETRRAEESARKLLAVLSHELRTPATTIRSTLEALGYPMSEAQRSRFLAQATEEAERLIRLLEDLTIDVKPPALRRIELDEVAARAVALLEDTFARRQVTVEVALPPMTVWADRDKLLQVLINLLENAAIHGPDREVVTLGAELDPAEPAWALITVRDRGKPLPEEAFERLFEPHARGGPRSARGAGLGLYIVRSIAQRWGGRAWGRPLEQGNEFGFSVQVR